jgi:hypothetical protein
MRKDVYFLKGKQIFLVPAFVLHSASLPSVPARAGVALGSSVLLLLSLGL